MKQFFAFFQFTWLIIWLLLSAQRSSAVEQRSSIAEISSQDSVPSMTSLKPGGVIEIKTDHFAINFEVGKDGRLYQMPIGKGTDAKKILREEEAYPQAGDGYILEPALQVTHADGNTSTSLRAEFITRCAESQGRVLIRIDLHDSFYPFKVSLLFRIYPARDVIEQWVEISHEETGPVILQRMCSTALLLPENAFLTHFSGDWAKEMTRMTTEKLTPGLKVLDSKIGVRAHQFRNPNFILSFDGPPAEDSGYVLAGCLAWSGNFQCTFDGDGPRVRALCGVNPFASDYQLKPSEKFVTPAMLWTWSSKGLGEMSRKLHAWARDFGIRDGHSPRPVILNNWEATGFHFDESRIAGLLPPAEALGTELFLLDDGWFGARYPRLDDRSGLGDWMPNPKRFPNGLAPLAADAGKHGMRFGIWIEPEMVNPASELFEKHPDWVICQPNRELELQRNQLTLDLTRPEVHDYEWEVIRGILSIPGISYAKWDCNRYLTQPGSTYLAANQQGRLWIDYVNSLYDLMKKTSTGFPKTGLMLCAGGGGRVDYGALRYFDEFWPSDNTDPLTRVTMQWDYSMFFPAIAISAHVTRPKALKYSFDVAMSGRLGMDMDLSHLSPEDIYFAKAAVETYKKKVLSVVQFGDLYRIESPHTYPRSVLDYVSEDRSRAVLFILQTKNAPTFPAKPQGLDQNKKYKVTELNLKKGEASTLTQNGQIIDGATLMRDGLTPSCSKQCDSSVIEFASP